MKNKLSYGFSLIEVLISLLLLGIVLLGLEGMQLYALKENRQAWLLAVAINQVDNMAERVHALGENSLPEEEVTRWSRQNTEVLPNSKSAVDGKYPSYVISLRWQGGDLHETISRVYVN